MTPGQIKKGPDPIDVHAGQRLRQRRTEIGLSQERLGDRIGITFQQVQKYEKGTNRISASRLKKIAEVLGVPVAFFYDGLQGGAEADGLREDGPDYLPMEGEREEARALALAFRRIRDPALRRHVLELVRALAGPEGGEGGSERKRR